MTQSTLERGSSTGLRRHGAAWAPGLRHLALSSVAPPAVLVALPLLLFWPLVVGGRVLYWGTPLLQFYPWRSFAAELFREGQLPVWNPYLGTGFPLAANLQSAVFYPLNVLLFFAVPAEVGLGLSVVIHVTLAGLFTYAFVRAVGLSRWASLLSAVCYMFSGFVIARAGFLSMSSAAAWLPVLLLAIEVLSRGVSAPDGRRRLFSGSALLIAGSTMLLLAGHAQLAFYSLLCAVGYAVVRAVQLLRSVPSPKSKVQGPKSGREEMLSPARLWTRDPRPWTRHGHVRRWPHVRKAATLLAFVGLALAGAFCAAGIQLVPTAELTSLSVRASGAEREFALTYSLWPSQILGVLAPDAFGNPASDNYWGPGNYWEVASYVGVLPLGLAVLAVWHLRRRRARALGAFFAALAVLALLLATGKYLPIFVLAYEHVPGFGSFQAPARMLFFYTFAVAYLAGDGLDQLLNGGPQRASNLGRRLVLVGVGFLVAGSIGMALAAPVLGVRITFAGALIKLGALLAMSGLVVSLPLVARRLLDATRLPPMRWSAAWPAVLLAFVAADLLVYGAPLNPTITPEVYRVADLPAVRYLRESLGSYRLYTPQASFLATFHRVFSFKSFGPSDAGSISAAADLLPPNVALSARLSEAYNYDPLELEDLHRLQQLTDATLRSSLLNVMAVRYVLSDTVPSESNLPLVFDKNPLVRENRNALPRAFVAYSARRVKSHEEALTTMDSGDFDPRAEVVLEGPVESRLGQSRPASAVTITLADPRRVMIRLQAVAASYLVLSDAFYPGWQVEVDGERAEMLRANFAFRAVELRPGEHDVEFRYQPRSYEVGLALSLAGMVVLGALCLAGCVRSLRLPRTRGMTR